ncbi:MAG: Na+ dependent nucleoside transporter N-terminal domain-containing protein [Burkholderiales bacterium]
MGTSFLMFLVLLPLKHRLWISCRLVKIAIGLQFSMCSLMIRAPFVKEALLRLSMAVVALGMAVLRGTSFVFGFLAGGSALPA